MLLMVAGCMTASALSFALDSVAQWGRFPKFCVDVYRWGDGFFNGYDTTYVVGAGYKFNTKVRVDSWVDTYTFFLPDKVRMGMRSDPSTSIGLNLTYLAVTAGYDKNISHFFGGPDDVSREQYSFGFNCSLFAFNMYFNRNNGGNIIRRFGPPGHTYRPHLEFGGLSSKSFGFSSYYFINHKKYSQAAAFSFSRIQKVSQGSWFTGVSYYSQTFDFDFNELPVDMKSVLPESWTDYKYNATTQNIALILGYGYNWALGRKWLIGVSEAPAVGLKIGKLNDPDDKNTNTVAISNQLKASVVWNHKEWFAGAMGIIDTAILYDKESMFQNSAISGSLMLGYRFNLW